MYQVSYTPTHDWDKDGDCIGLGQKHGSFGSYTQSDVQFAQEVQHVMRWYTASILYKEDPKDHKLPDYLNIDIYAHFFRQETLGYKNKDNSSAIASQLRVDYSEDFFKLNNENEIKGWGMKPVSHGYESTEMFNSDIRLDMNGRVI